MTKLIAVDTLVLENAAVSEHFEKLLVSKRRNGGELQLEQRILMWIHVYAMNRGRIADQVVQGITPRARDHHDAVAGTDIQYGIIDRGIFPALVVYEISRVDLIEELSRQGYAHESIFSSTDVININRA